MDDTSGVDICRVCRSEGLPDRPLFHPCICTGSIKWIHQECLVQWMRYSRKEYCELCSHHFSFTPIYSPDMPRRLPLRDVAGGLLSSIATALKCWLHYTLVALAWLGLVPLTACRIYRCFFSLSLDSIITLPTDIIKTQNILSDVFHGCFIVMCSLSAFFGIVWLREQIVHGGGPDWLDPEQEMQQQQLQQQQIDQQHPEHDEHEEMVRQPAEESTSGSSGNSVNAASSFSEAGHSSWGESMDMGEPNHHESDGEVTAAGASKNVDSSNSSESLKTISLTSDRSACDFDSSIPTPDGGPGTGHQVEDGGKSEGASCEDGKRQCDNSTEGIFDWNQAGSSSSPSPSDDNDVFYEVEADFGRIYAETFEAHENNLNDPQEEYQEQAEGDNEPGMDENQVEGGGDVPGGENALEDGNWNPIEWDRGVEELTWERLLGLDGSMLFLQNVFWVVLLNALLIFFFAFLPYHLGNLAIGDLGLWEKTVGTHFEGLITTLFGYCVIGVFLVVLHTAASLLGLQRSKTILGLCYVIFKVSLLSAVDIGVLPLICGWWLDICSLSMFDATLKDRETSFRLAPGTSMFIHWLVGMVYVYYFSAFILLLREVVRPGVLWFLTNLNDPDYSPIQEMIHRPILDHVRRILVTSITYGTGVLLMFWFPIMIIRYLWPTFLPYAVALQIEAQMNELSLELLLFQVILPSLLEQSHTRIWMKGLIRLWCKCAAWILGIHSYLLGDDGDQNGNTEQGENNDNNQALFNGLGAFQHHQALLPREGPIGVQPFQKPSWFYARLLGLLFGVCVSLVIASLAALTLPVWIGRQIMGLWLGGSSSTPPAATAVTTAIGEEVSTRVHELYTAACGTYLCWLVARAATLLRSWLPQGRAAILDTERLKQWCLWGTKSLIAFTFLLGIIPLLFGLLLELFVVVPLRVPLYQTPVLFIWQDWALGVLYTKIACAMILMGPDWKLRRAIERVYRDGIRNMDLSFILCELALPVTEVFSLALAVPYATAHSIIPLVISNVELKNMTARLLYPSLLVAFILSCLIALQIEQFKKFYEHIKNDKYLVGKRLVNYDHRRSKSSTAS